jgi:hypothetical protein
VRRSRFEIDEHAIVEVNVASERLSRQRPCRRAKRCTKSAHSSKTLSLVSLVIWMAAPPRPARRPFRTIMLAGYTTVATRRVRQSQVASRPGSTGGPAAQPAVTVTSRVVLLNFPQPSVTVRITV